MVHIAICDDESALRVELGAYVERYATERRLEYKLTFFSDADSLLVNYPEGLDILLLDICMEGTDGIAAARRIRMFDADVCIVIITGTSQFALEGYSVQAYNYLLKPVRYPRFVREFEAALRSVFARRISRIPLKTHEGLITVDTRAVLFGEKFERKSRLHMIDGSELLCHAGLAELEPRLSSLGFAYCHSSVLVNTSFVRTVLADRVVLQNGCEVPLSRRYKKSFMEQVSARFGGML